jgi:phage-related protein
VPWLDTGSRRVSHPLYHCLQKKSQKTDKQDIEIGKKRYNEIPD